MIQGFCKPILKNVRRNGMKFKSVRKRVKQSTSLVWWVSGRDLENFSGRISIIESKKVQGSGDIPGVGYLCRSI